MLGHLGTVVYYNVFCFSFRSGRLVLPLRFVGGVQRHCVMLWAVSTLLTKAYIAASCHSVVLWVVQHRWAIDSRLSLAASRESLQNGQRSLSSIFSD